ncbi:serine/threonine-protein kinase [Nonomuraea sediminis]|uniref:serine/threonine-protein kinase n=1 Tax=Nonomuraea sediminis TaxID=2835864 RepID=UPI001BDCCEF8|nr:serine/threonine-protein kinase [Nonomuraea sediminis]
MPQISPLVAGDPSQLGSFRLTGRIGEGGQGIVYLGANEQGERAAIKLLHVKFSGDTIARSRFARELKAAQRVASFCTARVMEADLEGNTPYIASEYIDGRVLRDVVEADGPLQGTALDRLAIGTATALTAIHHASIVHRDFKPDNVLIAADGPRVVDFGIARIIDSTGTITSRAIGTPAYMAPEQIAGDDIGPYTDVFAWGATLAFAATGKTAFEGNSIAVVLNRILNHEVDVEIMPEPLRGVVRSALAKAPAERPSADQILLRLLGQPETVGASTAVMNRAAQLAGDDTMPIPRVSTAVTEHKPVVETSLTQSPSVSMPLPVTAPPPPPPVRRRRTGMWIGLIMALVLLAAAAVALLMNGFPSSLALGQEPPATTPPPTLGENPAQPAVFSAVADKIAQTGKVTIGVKVDLPGIGLQRNGGFEGFDVELARRIATALGAKQTVFTKVTKANRADMLAEGTVDLVLATYSIDKSEVQFAGPYYLAHHDVLIRDGDSIKTLADLKGRKLCAPDSPSVGEVQSKVKVEPVPASNYAQCMDLLRNGGVDAIPGDDLILAGFASRENLRFRVLGAQLNDERYAVGIKQGDAKTCKAVTGVIKDLYHDGTMKSLLSKYFGQVGFNPELKVPAMEPCG